MRQLKGYKVLLKGWPWASEKARPKTLKHRKGAYNNININYKNFKRLKLYLASI